MSSERMREEVRAGLMMRESIDQARFPRPGPQLPARRCEHAASGCNYPEGDCTGLCLVAAPAKAA